MTVARPGQPIVTASLVAPGGGALDAAGKAGTASLTANFVSGNLSGNLSNMMVIPWEGAPLPWNSLSITAGFFVGTNEFAGTLAATSSPGGIASMSAAANGEIRGNFFGPSANELGAVWVLHDATRTAVGSIGAKTP